MANDGKVLRIKEGEIFVFSGGLPHSPRRSDLPGAGDRRERREEEKEEFT